MDTESKPPCQAQGAGHSLVKSLGSLAQPGEIFGELGTAWWSTWGTRYSLVKSLRSWVQPGKNLWRAGHSLVKSLGSWAQPGEVPGELSTAWWNLWGAEHTLMKFLGSWAQPGEVPGELATTWWSPWLQVKGKLVTSCSMDAPMC